MLHIILKVKNVLYFKVGHISDGFKMAEEERDFSGFYPRVIYVGHTGLVRNPVSAATSELKKYVFHPKTSIRTDFWRTG